MRDNSGRAKKAKLYIKIMLVLELIYTAVSLLQYFRYKNYASDTLVEYLEFNVLDFVEMGVALAYFVLTIVSGIFFIRWFRRAYFNLHTKVDYLSFSEGWAAGSWFIPLLNWFRPYQIMKEIYMVLSDSTNQSEKYNLRNINLWWFFWIISSLLGNTAARMGFRAETIADYAQITYVDIVCGIVILPLSYFALKVINTISDMELVLQSSDSLEQILGNESKADTFLKE